MPEASDNKKDKVYWSILNSAIELDIKKGHQKWTLSDLSRKSGITRSLIYYYFGKKKSEILKEAIRVVGEEFIGLSPERMQLWETGELLTSMKKARELNQHAPYISLFILENRNKENEIGDSLREIQGEFIKKLKSFFCDCNDDQISAIFSIYWGLSFSPILTEEGLKQVIQTLLNYHKS